MLVKGYAIYFKGLDTSNLSYYETNHHNLIIAIFRNSVIFRKEQFKYIWNVGKIFWMVN